MNTTTYIKHLADFTGDARLYKLNPPLEYDGQLTEFIVVSAADVLLSGPETYIFPADVAGKIISWGELDESFRGGLDHNAALFGAGYEVVE